jgi:hypothetical protein
MISKTKKKEKVYFNLFYLDNFPTRPVKRYQKDRERSFQRGRQKSQIVWT